MFLPKKIEITNKSKIITLYLKFLVLHTLIKNMIKEQKIKDIITYPPYRNVG